MELNKLNLLAEKFWNGECSEAEEHQLREYFRWNESTPSEFNDLRDYLNMMGTESEGLSLDFDQKILASISSKKGANKWNIRSLYPIVGAAMVLIGIFIATQISRSEEEQFAQQTEDTYEDPEQAFLEVKKALMMVSGKMNKGKKYSNELGKFSVAAEHIETQNK